MLQLIRYPKRDVARSGIAVASFAGALLIACSTRPAGLELIITTDLNAPDDYDTLYLQVSQEGTFADESIQSVEPVFPVTFAIAAGSLADQEAIIDVSLHKAATIVVSRQAQVQVPKDRVAALTLVLGKKCVGVMCPPGQTCDPEPDAGSGACVPIVVDQSALPTFTPGPVPGGGSSSGSASGLQGNDGGNSAPSSSSSSGMSAGNNTGSGGDASSGSAGGNGSSGSGNGSSGSSGGADAGPVNSSIADSSLDAPADGVPDAPEDTTVDALSDVAMCGGTGEACCAGNTCSGGGCCDPYTNKCTASGTACAAPGSVCAVAVCQACGASGFACCAGNTCNGGGCCDTDLCVMSGAMCSGGLACLAGSCAVAAEAGGASAPTNDGGFDGFLAFYPFTESSGTTSADATGNNQPATMVGATFSPGVVNNAATMNGSAQYVALPAAILKGFTAFSICTWVNLNDPLMRNEHIFDFGTGPTAYMFLTPNSGSGNLQFAITTNGLAGEQTLSAVGGLATAGWEHVCVTLAPTSCILYVNGAQVAKSAAITLNPSSLGNTTQDWLGRSQYTADPYLNGKVDQFRVYSRALSAAEVQQLFQLME